jgi:hypothetical protein
MSSCSHEFRRHTRHVHNGGGGDELESTASNACQMSMYQALMATWL